MQSWKRTLKFFEYRRFQYQLFFERTSHPKLRYAFALFKIICDCLIRKQGRVEIAIILDIVSSARHERIVRDYDAEHYADFAGLYNSHAQRWTQRVSLLGQEHEDTIMNLRIYIFVITLREHSGGERWSCIGS